VLAKNYVRGYIMISEIEHKLSYLMALLGLPIPNREYRFHPERRWRFDFAWPDLKLAAEVEGGAWVQGRHTRGAGFERDCEKYNAAALLGWRVLRFTAGMVEDGRAVEMLEKCLKFGTYNDNLYVQDITARKAY
jgi:hypothetical protein